MPGDFNDNRIALSQKLWRIETDTDAGRGSRGDDIAKHQCHGRRQDFSAGPTLLDSLAAKLRCILVADHAA